METMEVSCPNGHRLSGSNSMMGRKVRCPKCSVTFAFAAAAKNALTETGVLRILGDVPPLPMPTEQVPKVRKACPRCSRFISVHANVCEHCACYVGAMPHFVQQMIQDSKKPTPARRLGHDTVRLKNQKRGAWMVHSKEVAILSTLFEEFSVVGSFRIIAHGKSLGPQTAHHYTARKNAQIRKQSLFGRECNDHRRCGNGRRLLGMVSGGGARGREFHSHREQGQYSGWSHPSRYLREVADHDRKQRIDRTSRDRHGCKVEDNVLIGMGAIVMDDAHIHSNVIIAAGAVVLEKTIVEANSIYAGIPARKVKAIDSANGQEIQRIANNY